MRIALIGTRGVPATYGGFETAVEEIGARLAEYGHEVTVYCRRRTEKTSHYRGMTTVDLPALQRRSMETLSHSAASVVHAVSRDHPDVAIVFNAANSALLPLLRVAKIPCALHTDGLEWKRGKWGRLGKTYYLISEALSVHLADQLISDATGISDYYDHRYSRRSVTLRYGAELVYPEPALLEEHDLTPGGYHLVVSRLEPENHVDTILRGAIASTARLPIVVVGSIPYATDYSREVERLSRMDSRVRMLGSVWDQRLLDTLYAHTACYLHGHSVGGTNPSLLRAMGAGAPVAAYDVSFNREVLGADDDAFWTSSSDVAEILTDVEKDPEPWRAQGERGRQRIADGYRWDDVAHGYESLCEDLLAGRTQRDRRGLRRLRETVRAARDPSLAVGPWSS